MNALIPLLCGAIFSAGVCISGMVRPSKVLGFLDVAGPWDATLMVVFATALALHVVAWAVVKAVRKPRFGDRFPGPPSPVVDLRLVGGAALFGIGWGLAGYCPPRDRRRRVGNARRARVHDRDARRDHHRPRAPQRRSHRVAHFSCD